MDPVFAGPLSYLANRSAFSWFAFLHHSWASYLLACFPVLQLGQLYVGLLSCTTAGTAVCWSGFLYHGWDSCMLVCFPASQLGQLYFGSLGFPVPRLGQLSVGLLSCTTAGTAVCWSAFLYHGWDSCTLACFPAPQIGQLYVSPFFLYHRSAACWSAFCITARSAVCFSACLSHR